MLESSASPTSSSCSLMSESCSAAARTAARAAARTAARAAAARAAPADTASRHCSLGYNGVGFNNPAVITPNIDALAADGLKLASYYTYKVCAPARASFLTGRNPYKLAAVKTNFAYFWTLEGTNASYTMFPKKLQSVGYETYVISRQAKPTKPSAAARWLSSPLGPDPLPPPRALPAPPAQPHGWQVARKSPVTSNQLASPTRCCCMLDSHPLPSPRTRPARTPPSNPPPTPLRPRSKASTHRSTCPRKGASIVTTASSPAAKTT
jgi:hypothetical protein